MLYFAYGSNLHHFQMKRRCKDSVYLKKINLKNLSNSDSVSIVGFANKSKKEYPNSPDVILYASSSPEASSSESTKVEVDDESPML